MVCAFGSCILAMYMMTASPPFNRDVDRAMARDTTARDTTARDMGRADVRDTQVGM